MPPAMAHKGKIALTRPRKGGDVRTLTRILWRAVLEAERLLVDAEDAEMRAKGVHAVVQACGAYLKMLEGTELEARLAVVEQAQKGQA